MTETCILLGSLYNILVSTFITVWWWSIPPLPWITFPFLTFVNLNIVIFYPHNSYISTYSSTKSSVYRLTISPHTDDFSASIQQLDLTDRLCLENTIILKGTFTSLGSDGILQYMLITFVKISLILFFIINFYLLCFYFYQPQVSL